MTCTGTVRLDMDEPAFLTTREVAEALRVSPQSVRRWRVRGNGPVYALIGGSPKYLATDVERYVAERRFRRVRDARENRPVPTVAPKEPGR